MMDMPIRIKKGFEMVKKLILISFLWIMSLHSSNNVDPWTWIHHVRCNEIIRVTNNSKKTLFCEKIKVNPFTQLIFSWNIVRPQVGYFSFYVQVRDAETKRWGIWHHMADWGAGMQQSYLSKSDGVSSFVHVRLEVDNKKVADAYRIKIIPRDNASLSCIYAYSIATSNFNLFKAEQIVSDNLASVYIKNVPLIAQFELEYEDNGRICSPVSCAMLVNYLTNTYQDPIAFALQSFDAGLGVYGSWPYNMAHAFEQCNGTFHFFVKRMNTFVDLHEQLIKGMPVIVSVRGNLPGALKPFPHGHLLIVVGWDKETRQVLCHDPAAESNEKVFKRYPIADFLPAWERSHRLAYVAEPVKSVFK